MLHKLKSRRGYTMMEMIIVIAILAIMAGTISANTSSRYNRIREATSTAQDFYTVIQTEFTRFQMFDGPLTMELQRQYAASPDKGVGTRRYGGLMWFPRVGGNYPIKPDADKMAAVGVGSDVMTWRNKALPRPAGITIEVHVVNNKILSVDWDYTTAALFAKTLDDADDPSLRSELSAVLQLELDRRMEYKDGYYYARIIYTNQEASNLGVDSASSASLRASPVTVLWAAYCRGQFTSDEATYTFRKAYTSNAGEIVGIVGGTTYTGDYLGSTGSNIVNATDMTLMM